MRFQCPFCRGIVAVENDDLGMEVQCGHCSEIVAVPLSRVATGAVINDFIILEELGRGGMGIVYLAYQISLDRPAALKILADSYANNAEFVVGFIKEARAAAKLNHPHIVQAYAVGEDEGVFYFAMEHVDGETMKQVLKREKVIPVERALTIIQQIAEALDYAWKEQHLIHRDIKPDNIMIAKNGRAKLADLGLARVASDIDDSNEEEVMGTPQYISPEHLTGAPMDVRSDIYSLGATLFHLLTGRFPFEGRTATEIARKHLDTPLRPPKDFNPKVPDAVCRIVQKMMAKNVKHRYQDAEELVEDLRLARRGKSPVKAVKSSTRGMKTVFVSTKTGKTTGKFTATKSRTGKFTKTGGVTKSGKVNTGTTGKVERVQTQEGIEELEEFEDENVTTASELLKKREAKAKKQIVLLIIVCLIAGAVAIGLTVWKMMASKEKDKTGAVDNKGKGPGKKPSPPKTVKVSSEYTKEVAELLDFYKKNPKSKKKFIIKCDKFFLKYGDPKNESEIVALNNLMDKFVPLDEEQRIRKVRNIYRKKHLQILKEQEEEQKRKAEEEREREEKARRQKELKEQQTKMLEERKRLEQEREDKYKKELESLKNSMRRRFIACIKRDDYVAAEKIFSTTSDEESRYKEPGMKKIAEQYVNWGRRMRKCIRTAEKVWKLVNNGGSKMARTQLEYNRSLGRVVSIKKKIITLKLMSGKTTTIKLNDLAKKQVYKLIKKAAEVLGDNDATFYYLLVNGDFRMARRTAPDSAWKKETSAIMRAVK